MDIRPLLYLFLFIGPFNFACNPSEGKEKHRPPSPKIALAIHGGAGTIKRENMTAEEETAYKAKLQEALDAGFAVLESGEDAVEAVIEAVKILEDSPLFNAGKGAVFTHDGRNEMDAAIMEGATKNAGAVAGITRVKNPDRKSTRLNSSHV